MGFGMSTTSQPGTASYEYIKAIGNAAAPGQIGFRNPVDVAVGQQGLLYVLNHAAENTPNGKRVAKCTIDDEFLGEFGTFGTDDGQFSWPNSIALDQEGNVYVSDEWLHRISVFDPDGHFLHKWGIYGQSEGELDRPAGIAFDRDDNLLAVDSLNHRVQRFTKGGKFLATWGGPGKGEGEFDSPWGITVDSAGDVYVADWRNDRVQKFTADGKFLMQLGGSGGSDGAFRRPSDVAVDRQGHIYVADWGNDRVQVFDAECRPVTRFFGDAGLSKWGVDRLSTNPENMLEQRTKVKDTDSEKWLVQPSAVAVDDAGRVIVVDSARHRLQIYQMSPA